MKISEAAVVEENMKIQKKCPKCGSQSITRIPAKDLGIGGGNIIKIKRSYVNAVKVTRYMCNDCGFLEEWVDNKEDIKKVVNKYGDQY